MARPNAQVFHHIAKTGLFFQMFGRFAAASDPVCPVRTGGDGMADKKKPDTTKCIGLLSLVMVGVLKKAKTIP
jgi:hypothetical protein